MLQPTTRIGSFKYTADGAIVNGWESQGRARSIVQCSKERETQKENSEQGFCLLKGIDMVSN